VQFMRKELLFCQKICSWREELEVNEREILCFF